MAYSLPKLPPTRVSHTVIPGDGFFGRIHGYTRLQMANYARKAIDEYRQELLNGGPGLSG